MLECNCYCGCCGDVQLFAPSGEAVVGTQLVCHRCSRPVVVRNIQQHTEADWLACTDPVILAQCIPSEPSKRKHRLFGCACARLVWERWSDPLAREIVNVSERYADRCATEGELATAATAAFQISNRDYTEAGIMVIQTLTHRESHAHWTVFDVTESDAVTKLLREIFGNPFRPVTFDPAWRSSTVTALAQAIYEERVSDRLPILADALEDSGWTNVDMLGHCRGGGEHVRGCWVVDLVLGKG